MTIHREGRSLLLGLLTALIIINLVAGYLLENALVIKVIAGASLLLLLLILQFFRSPSIQFTTGPKNILAPADGKVVALEQTLETEYLNERRKQISIFMSPLNVHINRMPAGGRIVYMKYHPGKYLVAWHPKSSTENERNTIVVKTEGGPPILFRQIAGAMARRIKWYVHTGQSLNQGEEFGFIKFGSRVDVFVPLDAQVSVEIGSRTKAGVTVLAVLT